jgi:quercetin dioxygenase-like cupin family protein
VATPIDLFQDSVHVLDDGTTEVAVESDTSATTIGDGVVMVEPRSPIRATISAARMAESPRHRGERHIDGDELVYLVSGSAGLSLQRDYAEENEEVRLRPGQLVVVSRGVWHRLVVDEPSEMIFLTPGRTEVRVSEGSPGP